MKNPFELAPLLVAAVIGAVILVIMNPTNSSDTGGTVLNGAMIGAGVQLGVRLLGVS